MLLMTSILCHLAEHFTIQHTVGVAQKVAQFETFALNNILPENKHTVVTECLLYSSLAHY